MKTIDSNPTPKRISDPVIREVRRIKEEIIAEHGVDIRQLLKSLRERQMGTPRLVRKAEGEQGIAPNA
jgi:hypothetical protein